MRSFWSGLLCVGMCVLATGSAAAQRLAASEVTLACQQTGKLYAHYADQGLLKRLPDLFTEAGVWETTGGLLEGRAAIAKQMQGAEPGQVLMRHLITNHLVFDDGGKLSGHSYFTLYRSSPDDTTLEGQPVMVGTYRDEYEMVGDTCLFSSRRSSATYSR